MIEHFIYSSKDYLNKNGVIYFIISSDISLNMVENMFREQNFEFEIVKKIEKFFETFYITKSFLIT